MFYSYEILLLRHLDKAEFKWSLREKKGNSDQNVLSVLWFLVKSL